MPEGAEDVHKAIREWFKENVSQKVAGEIRILFGGSVESGNANEYICKENIDGLFASDFSNKFVQ